MSGHPGVEWLRSQIEARHAAARRADTGEAWEAERHYDGLWLVDLTPGAGPVEDADTLRDASIPLPDASTFEAPRFLWAFAPHARHIAANDPRDVIARCEAELTVLDLYSSAADVVARAQAQFREAAAVPPGHTINRDYLDGLRELAVLREVLARVAKGYRHRPGYAEHWGNPA